MHNKPNNLMFLVSNIPKDYVEDLIIMLQEISAFYPTSEEIFNHASFLCSKPDSIPVIGIVDNKVVSFATLHVMQNIRGGSLGVVEDVVVSPGKTRRVGIGKQTINKILEVARAKNCYKVYLQCKQKNQKFYENCGFAVNGLAMQVML